MKFLNFMAYALTASAMTFAFAACGGDDDNPDPDPVPKPDPVKEVLSAEEAKEYLEDAANKFLYLFDSNDQRQLAELAEYVNDNYGKLDAPAAWDADDRSFTPDDFTRAMARAYKTRSYAPVSRASYVYRFSDYAGVYEAGSRAWIKTGDSKDIIFRFKGAKGDCELKAVADKGEWNADWEEDWDKYTVKVPGRVRVTLTEASTVLVDITVDSNANTNSRTATLNVNATVMNLNMVAAVNASNSEIVETQTLSVNGTPYQTSTATLRGKNMLEENTFDRLDEGRLEYGDVFSNASANVDVMGYVQVRGTASNFSAIADALDETYWDSYKYDSPSEAEVVCRRACDNFNKNVDATVYFSGTNVAQASIILAPEFEDESGYGWRYWEWSSNPVIQYKDDDSTQSFDDFFEDSSFASVEDHWDSIIRAYKRLWDFF